MNIYKNILGLAKKLHKVDGEKYVVLCQSLVDEPDIIHQAWVQIWEHDVMIEDSTVIGEAFNQSDALENLGLNLAKQVIRDAGLALAAQENLVHPFAD